MKNKAHGYIFTLLAVTVFAVQDGLSKHLGTLYPPIFVAMMRYWAFAVFVLLLAARSGGIRHAATTKRPLLQIFRGVLLVAQIVVMIHAFAHAGMAMSQSILQGTPLIVTLLSVPLLGEKVGWRRLTAVVIGLFGVLLIINPVSAHFDTTLLVPVLGAFMFALYGIATRAVGRVMALFMAASGGFASTSLPRRFRPVHWIGAGLIAAIAAISLILALTGAFSPA